MIEGQLRAAALVLLALAALPDAAAAAGFETLYRFRGGPAGGAPSAFTVDASGAIYGTTHEGGDLTYPTCPSRGCGTVFRIDPPTSAGGAWRYNVLYRFRGLAFDDGARPFDGVVRDRSGRLFGTTYQGGAFGQASGGYGTVFKLSPPEPGRTRWTRTILHDFRNEGDGATGDGGFPYAGLTIGDSGALYGTTRYGGATGRGTVFRLSPPRPGRNDWVYAVLHHFRAVGDGPAYPLGRLALDRSGRLFGTTEAGGRHGYGTVFMLTPDATGRNWPLRTLHSFKGGSSDGAQPRAGIVIDRAGAIYGATPYGGAINSGVLFRLKPPARAAAPWSYSVLHDFFDDGRAPHAPPLLHPNGSLYGTTVYGGPEAYGSTYRLRPPLPGSTKWRLSQLHGFAGARNGRLPVDGLFAGRSGWLYGVATNGGIGDCNVGCGALFRVKP